MVLVIDCSVSVGVSLRFAACVSQANIMNILLHLLIIGFITDHFVVYLIHVADHGAILQGA